MKLKTLIFTLLAPLLIVGCSPDEDQLSHGNVDCCVKVAWNNGRGGSTRAFSSLLDGVSGTKLELSPEDYPSEISVRCNEKSFLLSKSDILTACDTHEGFYNGYTSDYKLKDNEAKKGVTATALMDGGDELYSEKEDVVLDGLHLKFTMHHRKALIRFLFKVNEKYNIIRYINVKEVKLQKEGSATTIAAQMKEGGLVLKPDGYYCAGYCYVDPQDITATTTLRLACTYDIYDKDADFATIDADNSSHITRKDVTASNTLQLSNIIFSGATSPEDKKIRSGYYYDLNVTINPDYLYVLSEHDNKHIVIN